MKQHQNTHKHTVLGVSSKISCTNFLVPNCFSGWLSSVASFEPDSFVIKRNLARGSTEMDYSNVQETLCFLFLLFCKGA